MLWKLIYGKSQHISSVHILNQHVCCIVANFEQNVCKQMIVCARASGRYKKIVGNNLFKSQRNVCAFAKVLCQCSKSGSFAHGNEFSMSEWVSECVWGEWVWVCMIKASNSPYNGLRFRQLSSIQMNKNNKWLNRILGI